MSDAKEFLNTYREILDSEINASGWPESITEYYLYESCLKHTGDKEVYLVVDKRTGGKAILRVTSHDSYDRADAEWAMLSRLEHPGIPRTYGHLTTDKQSFIVREYIPGKPLDIVVSQKTLSTQEIFSIAKQLCDILSYLHQQVPPIIHRDIKPQNIIMKEDGTVVLTDFGIARLFKPGADSDTHYVGTLPYAPPEQYGYAQSTPQTDIYALGIVLIYLATGNPDRRNLEDKISDKKLYALIKRCIAFDPADRLDSVEGIKRFINQRYRSRTHRIVLAAAGVVIVVVVGVGISLLLESFPDSSEGASQDSTQSVPTSSGLTATQYASSGQLFDSTQTGNLTGNIGNGGFVVEGGGETYVAYSDGIRVMNADGTLGRIAVDVAGASSLNYFEGKLYFVGSERILCADPLTGEVTIVYSITAGRLFITDGKLYFENSLDKLSLYTIDFDGKNLRKAVDADPAYYRNLVGNYQYFANRNDGETLYRVDMTTGEAKQLYDQRSAWISIWDGTIYFSDFTIPGKMMRMNLDGSDAQSLASGSYSFVNATPYGLFFTNPEAQQIELMAHDGKTRSLLVKKTCGAFCITKDWIIYKNKDDSNKLWAARIDGTGDHALSV